MRPTVDDGTGGTLGSGLDTETGAPVGDKGPNPGQGKVQVRVRTEQGQGAGSGAGRRAGHRTHSQALKRTQKTVATSERKTQLEMPPKGRPGWPTAPKLRMPIQVPDKREQCARPSSPQLARVYDARTSPPRQISHAPHRVTRSPSAKKTRPKTSAPNFPPYPVHPVPPRACMKTAPTAIDRMYGKHHTVPPYFDC